MELFMWSERATRFDGELSVVWFVALEPTTAAPAKASVEAVSSGGVLVLVLLVQWWCYAGCCCEHGSVGSPLVAVVIVVTTAGTERIHSLRSTLQRQPVSV